MSSIKQQQMLKNKDWQRQLDIEWILIKHVSEVG